MSVSFKVDYLIYPIGSGDFLHAFFSTVCCRLEANHWGSRYPYLMKELYYRQLAWMDVPFARKELQAIQKGLRRLPPAAVVWDRENLSKVPPWCDTISPHITDLANYFVTNDGRDLLSVLLLAMDDAQALERPLEIVSL